MTRLGELERRVMDELWSSMGSERTVRDVAATLPTHAYTTVLTVLDRLERKGLVQRSLDGRAYRYSAVSSREEYTAELMHEALVGTADRDAALVRFAETVSAEEAAVLREALRQAGAKKPKGRPS